MQHCKLRVVALRRFVLLGMYALPLREWIIDSPQVAVGPHLTVKLTVRLGRQQCVSSSAPRPSSIDRTIAAHLRRAHISQSRAV